MSQPLSPRLLSWPHRGEKLRDVSSAWLLKLRSTKTISKQHIRMSLIDSTQLLHQGKWRRTGRLRMTFRGEQLWQREDTSPAHTRFLQALPSQLHQRFV